MTKNNSQTIPARLKELRNRSGLTVRQLASALEYKSTASYFRYEDDSLFRGEHLSVAMTRKLAETMVGLGSPIIMPDEVWALAGVAADPNDGGHAIPTVTKGGLADNTRSSYKLAAPRNENDVIPVRCAVQAGPGNEMFLSDGPLDYKPRPVKLVGIEDAYMVEVCGDSMMPRYRPRALLHVNPHTSARPGDAVVVYQSGNRVLVKEYVRQTREKLYLRQYNPTGEIEVEQAEVLGIHTVVGMDEP